MTNYTLSASTVVSRFLQFQLLFLCLNREIIMRKKAKKRSKDVKPGVSDSTFKQKVKAFFKPMLLYLNQLPVVIALKKTRDKASEKLLQLILAFFAFLSPCWSFFFIGTPKKNYDNRIWFFPNPFSDPPVDNEPTNTKRPELEGNSHLFTSFLSLL